MVKRPIINALLAALYIALIVQIIQTFTSLDSIQQTILIPMVILSLLVLSVAVMGFLFFYEPFRLYFENQKKEAVLFFWKTVGIFACFIMLFLIALFFFSNTL